MNKKILRYISVVLALSSVLYAYDYTYNTVRGGVIDKNYTIVPVFSNVPFKKTFSFNNVADKKLVIYNHGTKDSFQKENCGNWWVKPPKYIVNLNSDNTLVYYLCSAITDADKPTVYTARRAVEIEQYLDKFIALGFKPSNIYVAGHSAGAWATLLMPARAKAKFNSFFLSSPACCGDKVKRIKKGREIWNNNHNKEFAKLLTLPQKGVIFTFKDDPYGNKSDWQPLMDAHPHTVEIQEFDCEMGHRSNRTGCMGKTIGRVIDGVIGE